MHKKICMSLLVAFVTLVAVAQDTVDSLLYQTIDSVSVVRDAQRRAQRTNTMPMVVVSKAEMALNFSGNLMNSLEYLPGVQSMSVGSGFSKPMIRGMAFNRVSVIDNYVKQEGQQWGSDHGLEIDAYNVDQVNIQKGPASLLFGSDAMGGVIEILSPTVPITDGLFGSVDMLTKSVNWLYGGSLMMGYKRGRWFVRARYSEQHYADYAVPTDTIVYLTQKIPIADGHLNNTAGFDRSGSLYTQYKGDDFSVSFLVSNAYQRVGFFAGAHGIPDASNVIDDGNRRDIDLPYSFVNHFKSSVHLRKWWDNISLSWDVAYQNNHREEWSEFHTHYSNQDAPTIDPDRELAFMLNTSSSGLKTTFLHSSELKSTASLDLQYQDNDIAGYSFLLPAYTRFTTGVAWVSTYTPNDKLLISGGLRYDFGHIRTDEYVDEYLVDYLYGMGYSDEVVEQNRVRSYSTDRTFGDYSFSAGVVWNINNENTLRFNLGRSFRLPGANELASNGVHHSSFRHEQGDASLSSECGWQVDTEYNLSSKYVSVNVSPFLSWYSNYIYLRPTGEWSVLPHAGQIYRYSESEALFAGGELSVMVKLPFNFRYEFSGEYCYTYNFTENTALPYSPPLSMRNRLFWEYKGWTLFGEWHFVGDQNRVARNEDPTPGAQLFNFGLTLLLPFISDGATATLQADNIFNTKYLNHLSYYRQVEIPEPGRNFQLSIKIPLKIN
ncbi:MAG: TonB-dependent receptor [Rikenellaceae bacterium]